MATTKITTTPQPRKTLEQQFALVMEHGSPKARKAMRSLIGYVYRQVRRRIDPTFAKREVHHGFFGRISKKALKKLPPFTAE